MLMRSSRRLEEDWPGNAHLYASGGQCRLSPCIKLIFRAEDVKSRADLALTNAQEQLKEAESVTEALSEASGAQGEAAEKVEAAQADIDAARKDLAVIQEKMEEAIRTSDESVLGVQSLSTTSQPLQTKFIRNEARVKSAREAARDAKDQASAANAVLYRLNNEFKNVSSMLEEKTLSIGDAKDVAVDLQSRANSLANSATNKLSSIYGTVFAKNSIFWR